MTADAGQSVRIGLVGCGRISKNHFDAIAAVEGLKLVAVADTDVARAQGRGREARRTDTSRRSMKCCKGEPLDIVTICTPSGLHAAQGVRSRARRQARADREADGDLADAGR